MPLTYHEDSQLKDLLPVLDEHAAWMGRIVRQIFYPQARQTAQSLSIPDSFKTWLAQAAERKIIPAEQQKKLARIHDELAQKAEGLLVSGDKPEMKDYDALVILYDEFLLQLRRLERDIAGLESGHDPQTGLRAQNMVLPDLTREMERLSRRGRPFCLAFARIDYFDDIHKTIPQADFITIMKTLGGIIKECVRSFDDAYYMQNGEFLMSLKQTDVTGGTAALGRLKKLMQEKAPYCTLNGKQIRLSLSSCVAEPQPGDVMTDMIENMRHDLDRFGTESQALFEYVELSPLQRFVHALDDDSKKAH